MILGNEKSLLKAKKQLKSKNQPNILEKDNEDIWFQNNKTIKFSTDKKFISDRVKRTEYLKIMFQISLILQIIFTLMILSRVKFFPKKSQVKDLSIYYLG